MEITHIKLTNWKNFKHVNVDLSNRTFIVGPNASGKSNFLDAFRFLRDIAKSGGGLLKAIDDRGGLPKIRFLSARFPSTNVEIDITIQDNDEIWRYLLSIKTKKGGDNRTQIDKEQVWHNDKILLDRPDAQDKKDELRLTQTHLEQINANANFRQISDFFDKMLYLHLVPQLIRHANLFIGVEKSEDPFGQKFLERIKSSRKDVRDSRLRKIEQTLRAAVPQLTSLEYVQDDNGRPHLEARYEHWRGQGGAKQQEEQFSDGTLRLIGLLWSLLEGDTLLLLEEPELSLNVAIIEELPLMMHRVMKKKKRQVFLTTHSFDLLSDASIGGEEVLLLTPTSEGTTVEKISDKDEVRAALESGLTVAEITKPLIKKIVKQRPGLFDEIY